jgi:hypothetical protein
VKLFKPSSSTSENICPLVILRVARIAPGPPPVIGVRVQASYLVNVCSLGMCGQLSFNARTKTARPAPGNRKGSNSGELCED